MEKIKKNREDEDEAKMLIEETSKQLQEEAEKRKMLEKALAEMEERMVIGGNVLEEKEREQA